MTAASALDSIFVHASPRSGSTYFFNVLRRNESLMCFNEAIIDVFSYWAKREIARTEQKKWDTNHSFLERNSYSEFIEAWDSVMHLYPMFPSFQDYLPANGVLSSELSDYLSGLIQYARSKGKRPALCEVMSRGRAGALRGAFGGFHIAQIRDPLSQFGAFYRQLHAGEWYFLVFPAMELGFGGDHPLYSNVPGAWRLPVMPWPADNAAQRWASKIEYLRTVASPQPGTIERVFRWHMFSWILSNLAAICYSDFVLDLDKAHDDSEYRRSVVGALGLEIGVDVDFSDLKKFCRYYDFQAFDIDAACKQVVTAVEEASCDGRLDDAIRALGTNALITPPAAALDLLFSRIHEALAAMAASSERSYVSNDDWKALAEKNQRIWFNPRLRAIAQRLYPLAEPIVRAARRSGIWN